MKKFLPLLALLLAFGCQEKPEADGQMLGLLGRRIQRQQMLSQLTGQHSSTFSSTAPIMRGLVNVNSPGQTITRTRGGGGFGGFPMSCGGFSGFSGRSGSSGFSNWHQGQLPFQLRNQFSNQFQGFNQSGFASQIFEQGGTFSIPLEFDVNTQTEVTPRFGGQSFGGQGFGGQSFGGGYQCF